MNYICFGIIVTEILVWFTNFIHFRFLKCFLMHLTQNKKKWKKRLVDAYLLYLSRKRYRRLPWNGPRWQEQEQLRLGSMASMSVRSCSPCQKVEMFWRFVSTFLAKNLYVCLPATEEFLCSWSHSMFSTLFNFIIYRKVLFSLLIFIDTFLVMYCLVKRILAEPTGGLRD